MINTVILNVSILRFFLGMGGGMMNLVSGSLFSSYMASLVMWGDDELSLRFSSSLDMNCEVNFVCCYADSPISGSFNQVLLRRCFVVGPRHTWMYPLRFILQQDEY